MTQDDNGDACRTQDGKVQDDNTMTSALTTQDSPTKIGRKFNGRTLNERRLQRWQRGRLQRCVAFAATLLQRGCCCNARVVATLFQCSVVAALLLQLALLQRCNAAARIVAMLRRCSSRCSNAAALQLAF
ncbi:unnamed protein product [Sphagnum balticum]